MVDDNMQVYGMEKKTTDSKSNKQEEKDSSKDYCDWSCKCTIF